MALMAFSDSEVTNDKSCSKSCLQNYEALKKQYDDLLVKLDDTGFKASTYKRGHKEYLMGLLGLNLKSQITGQGAKGDMATMLSPQYHPLSLMRLTPLDFIYSDWVSDDEDDVEPIPKVEKKIVIPTATKKDFVKPETPVRRSVRSLIHSIKLSNGHKHMVPRAVLMKTGLKTVINARTVNTVRSVNTARPFSTARYMSGNIAHLSDFKDFDGGYVTFGGGAYRGRITGKVPKDGLTCLVAKATSEESMLWHRRLGHVNFKNINKLVKENLVYKEFLNKDELHDEDDATEESHDGSNLQNNGTADQQVNTAMQEVNTGSREVSTLPLQLITATLMDLVGLSPAFEGLNI
ncbi:ribonuclease H-like domain-containing protein [Tanacetum coccineum]